jgi:membrane associated rhomboid family serine protease
MLLRTTADFRRAMDLSLVLDEEGIAHELRTAAADSWAILVSDSDAERADRALRAFENENPGATASPRERAAQPLVDASTAVIAGMLFALATFAVRLVQSPAWYERGAADAAAILGGEWWRCVTALTLHGDEGHALGNAALGGILLAFLSRRLGVGLAALVLVGSGALGTLCAAALLRRQFVSIGASTAVFGALGALAAMEAMNPQSRRRAFVPLGAGLALLGFLGTSPHADLAGHLFGFGSGLVVGTPLSRVTLRATAGQVLCVLVALALPTFAWWRALRA